MSHAPLDIEGMTPPERLDLIGRLWESLSDADIPLTEAHRRELDRRLDRIERDGADGLSRDDLRAMLRQPRR